MTTPNTGSAKGSENAGSDDNEEPQTVSLESHNKLLAQRKADRDRARDLQAQLDTFKAAQEEAERARLAEQNQFKTIAENEKKRADTLAAQVTEMTTSRINATKRAAVKEALGGVHKDDYLKFADLSQVQMNDDGSIDPESVKAVASKFRESYPELVASKGKGNLPGNEAASSYQGTKPRSLSELKPDELRARLAALSAPKS